MSIDETQPAGSKTSRLKAWMLMADGWPAYRETIGRFFKYAFLVILLLLNVKIVFDGYSYYVARRSIDAELDSKKIASLEYLNVVQQGERALMRETLVTRCTERLEIALFRIFDVLADTKLKTYYAQTMAAKDQLVAELKENGPKFLDGSKEALDYVNSATFRVAEFNDKHLKKLATVNETDEAYRDFIGQIRKHLRQYNDLVMSDPALQKLAAEVQEEAQHHWHQQAVKTLEERLSRLKTERAAIRAPVGANLDEILARYTVWTDALTGRSGEGDLLDEMAVEAQREGQSALAEMDCQLLRRYNPSEFASLKHAANASAHTDDGKPPPDAGAPAGARRADREFPQ